MMNREMMMRMLLGVMMMAVVAVQLLLASCDVKNAAEDTPAGPVMYRQEMRDFIQNIRDFAVATDANFIVIPQNGQELITTDSTAGGPLAQPYVSIITGQAREDLFYGYTADNVATPRIETICWDIWIGAKQLGCRGW